MACPQSAFARTGNPETQKEWHNTYRDMVDNMYRTSYQDMIHGREVSVKNDFPAGYGGHVPSLRHDVLFRNTEFDRMHSFLRTDPGRDVLPSFADQNTGVPTYTKSPRGLNIAPTAGCGPDVLVKPPWALTLTLREPPTFRTSPQSSTPRSARGQRPMTTPVGFRNRANMAAMQAGQFAVNTDSDRVATGASNDPAAVKLAVAFANETSSNMAMPTETQVLSSARRGVTSR